MAGAEDVDCMHMRGAGHEMRTDTKNFVLHQNIWTLEWLDRR